MYMLSYFKSFLFSDPFLTALIFSAFKRTNTFTFLTPAMYRQESSGGDNSSNKNNNNNRIMQPFSNQQQQPSLTSMADHQPDAAPHPLHLVRSEIKKNYFCCLIFFYRH